MTNGCIVETVRQTQEFFEARPQRYSGAGVRVKPRKAHECAYCMGILEAQHESKTPDCNHCWDTGKELAQVELDRRWRLVKARWGERVPWGREPSDRVRVMVLDDEGRASAAVGGGMRPWKRN